MKAAFQTEKAQLNLKYNVEYQLRDKDGNIKQLFQENKLNRMIFSFFRKFVKPISKEGQVKKGLFNYLAAYGLRIPGITGNWQDKIVIANLITSAGKAGAASRVNGSGSEAAFTYIEVGTGTTAADVANTTLETAITDSGLARVNATASRVTTTVTNDTAQLTTTFSVSGTKAITESGLLNAASTGVLLCRQVFTAINVVSGDSLTITWKIKCS